MDNETQCVSKGIILPTNPLSQLGPISILEMPEEPNYRCPRV